jgi:hypothetical protein
MLSHRYRISRIDRGLYRRRRRSLHGSTSNVGIRQNAKREIEEIREIEAPIKRGATGEDVENLIVAIAEHARAKPETFEGIRHFYNGCLNTEQRARVYEMIARLAENLPGRRFVQSSFVLKQRRDRENAEFDARLRANDKLFGIASA